MINQAQFFKMPTSFYETSFLKEKLEPGSDFIHDYSGPRAGRLTDADAILSLLKEGKIQTSASKFLEYAHEVTGGHNYVAKWNLDSYRAASLYDVLGGASRKGEWGPMRWGGWDKPKSSETAQLGAGTALNEDGSSSLTFDNPEKREKRMKAFANYVAATNQELNMQDDQEDLDQLNKEMAALKVAGTNKDNFDDQRQRYGYVRYKKAVAGADVTNIVTTGNSYLGVDTRGIIGSVGGFNRYSPDWNKNNG